MDLGVAFSPTAQDDRTQTPGGSGQPSATPIQDAIKLLSLRLPSFRAPGVAALPLLQGPGSRGVIGAGRRPGGLQQILQQLLGGGLPQPQIIPGVEPTQGGGVQPMPLPTPPPDQTYDMGLGPGRTRFRDYYNNPANGGGIAGGGMGMRPVLR